MFSNIMHYERNMHKILCELKKVCYPDCRFREYFLSAITAMQTKVRIKTNEPALERTSCGVKS